MYCANSALVLTISVHCISSRLHDMTGIIKRLDVTKQDGGKHGHHSEPAITQERQRFSKIHESIEIISCGDLIRTLVVA